MDFIRILIVEEFKLFKSFPLYHRHRYRLYFLFII